jgi:hypothetical protein
MDIQLLLDRLDKVRQTSRDRWVACCPAHDDKTPSLQVTQANERVLIHCFAGCGGNEVLESVGLDFSVLYPEDQQDYSVRPTYKKPVMEDEFFVEIYKSQVRKGMMPEQADTDRYRNILVRTYGH